MVNSVGINELRLLEKASVLYEDGEFDAAFPLYKKLAESGNVQCQTVLGWMFETGNGADLSLDKAKLWYSLASKSGDAAGSFYLGKLYIETKNHGDAYKAFKLAAEQNYMPAIYRIGLMEYGGVGIETDKNSAYKNIKYARKLGHIFAYKTEAVMLMRGVNGFLGRIRGGLMYIYILMVGPIIGARNPMSDRVRD